VSRTSTGKPSARARRRIADIESPLLRGLPPIENPRARVLILGSMPGAASLAAGQYYAHPRNLFWPLLGAILGFNPGSDYALRVAALKRVGIALWDVIGRCRRRGSLDARIDPKSVVANDFAALLARHPCLHTVCFNGATAEASWRRHVLPALAAPGLRTLRLPSTSPANASIDYERKLAAWAAALGGTNDASPLPLRER
jgi:TDG/mug DNA glycosylase family protein